MTTETTSVGIARDHWGRPLVVPTSGGKRVPYTRATTFVSAVEDTYALSKWQQRMTALGLAERPDLRLAVSAHREDKDRLNDLCQQAMDVAKAHAGATTGTALHSLTEQLDRGLDVRQALPEDHPNRPDLEAYVRATRPLTAVAIEQFSVLDALKIGGTPDRVVRYQGKRYIADLKTGSIEWGFLKIAAQLAVYARSVPYDVETDQRLEPHGAELDRGIIIHLPAGEGACHLYWVDLLQGWEAVRVSRDVRQLRQLKFGQLVFPFVDPAPIAPPPVTQPQLQPDLAVAPAPQTDSQEDNLARLIAVAASREEVTRLWQDHATDWTPQLTELAKARISTLNKGVTV